MRPATPRATLGVVHSALPLAALAVTACARAAAAREFLVPDVVTLNDNGAWSWFEDERAVVDQGYRPDPLVVETDSGPIELTLDVPKNNPPAK